MAELDAAIAAAPDLILLDNMTLAEMTEAVRRVAGRVPLEASGGIELDDSRPSRRPAWPTSPWAPSRTRRGAVDLSFKLEPLP